MRSGGDTHTQQQKLKEIEFLNEKQVGLQYQIAGTKKKIVIDMKRIEDKFEYLAQLRRYI
jgi:hypothetical protein